MAGKGKSGSGKRGLIAKIRKPMAPAAAIFPDRKKYRRKRQDWREEENQEPQPAGKVNKKLEPRPGSD